MAAASWLRFASRAALLGGGAALSLTVAIAEPPTSLETLPPKQITPAQTAPLPIDLPTALRLVDANNPTIAIARVRLTEAYAHLDEARVAWLPDLRAGPAYQRHDGEIQNALGLVFPTNKSNLFVGGGAVASVATSEAYFGPLVARRLVAAQAAATRAVNNDVQLDVAFAYLDLLAAYGELAINTDTLARAEEMLRRAEAADQAGLSKTKADVTRARTEVHTRRRERTDIEARTALAAARLAQLLLLDPAVDLIPADPVIVPITLVPGGSFEELLAVGMMNRPELAESRALVEAALARWRQARLDPLLPRFDVSYLAGDFGGGINSQLHNFHGRGDGLAQATWELRNLGFGDLARTRARRAQYDEANLHVSEVQARVAAEIVAAAKTAAARLRSLGDAQGAVKEAAEMWRRLEEASFGLAAKQRTYDALEPLLAEQSLAQSRSAYLNEVIEYNRAQFRLYTALGSPPIDALPKATAITVEVPVKPPPFTPSIPPGRP